MRQIIRSVFLMVTVSITLKGKIGAQAILSDEKVVQSH